MNVETDLMVLHAATRYRHVVELKRTAAFDLFAAVQIAREEGATHRQLAEWSGLAGATITKILKGKEKR